MATGKFLSLEEARKLGKLGEFAKEQAIEPEVPDPRARFTALVEAMANGERPASQQKRTKPKK